MSSSDYERCVPLAGGDGQSSSFLTVTGGIICGGFGASDWKISPSHLLEEKQSLIFTWGASKERKNSNAFVSETCGRGRSEFTFFFLFIRQETCLFTTWSAQGRLIKQRRSTDCVFCFSPPAGASVWDFDSLFVSRTLKCLQKLSDATSGCY